MTASEARPCHDISAHYSWWRHERVGGWRQASALLDLAVMFINKLVLDEQAWLSMKPPYVLQLLLFRCTSYVSFTRGSTYFDIQSNIEVPLKLKQ